MASGVILVSDEELAVVVDVPILEVAGDGDWVAPAAMRVAEVVDQGVVEPPFVVVCVGAACARVPAFALAQRAAGRLIVAYVLIEPVLPPAGAADWPDAPVTVVTGDGALAHAAGLRGWMVTDADPLEAIAEVLEEN